jgi:hypothetical protein
LPSTKLEKKEKQILPVSERGSGKGKGNWGQGGEMAQTMYTHMNKCINNKMRNDRERG